MTEIAGKVAVITGGASGIGRAIADALASRGAKIVLADIESEPLAIAERQLSDSGIEALAVRTDVSRAEDVETLASKVTERFGAVHLLFNNAGVSGGKRVWEATVADWQWTLGVNLWGVIHGVRTFVPIMLAQGDECHVVNTASVAGLLSTPALGAYNVSKHGVVTLSETLYYDLADAGAKIGVSVLCPAWVNTRIADAERNRPAELQNVGVEPSESELAMDRAVRKALQSGKVTAADVAELTVAAILENRFYILPHPRIKEIVRARMEDILEERSPSYRDAFRRPM